MVPRSISSICSCFFLPQRRDGGRDPHVRLPGAVALRQRGQEPHHVRVRLGRLLQTLWRRNEISTVHHFFILFWYEKAGRSKKYPQDSCWYQVRIMDCPWIQRPLAYLYWIQTVLRWMGRGVRYWLKKTKLWRSNSSSKLVRYYDINEKIKLWDNYFLSKLISIVLAIRLSTVIRGTILNRTHGTDKNLYISLFLLTIFGPIYYGPS